MSNQAVKYLEKSENNKSKYFFWFILILFLVLLFLFFVGGFTIKEIPLI
jgi:uncharacterized integral membrane protein